MELFWNTAQVTLGIITPFAIIVAVIGLIYVAIGFIEYLKVRKEHQTEEWKKTAPFDDEATFYEVPNPTMVGVNLYKDGKEVWSGAIDKKGIL